MSSNKERWYYYFDDLTEAKKFKYHIKSIGGIRARVRLSKWSNYRYLISVIATVTEHAMLYLQYDNICPLIEKVGDIPMSKKKMSIQQLVEETTRLGGFFSCSFTKKSTGEVRTMLCRRGVKAGVKDAPGPNGSAARPAQDKRCNVLTVFDVHAMRKHKKAEAAYRRINLSGLLYVTHNKTKYEYNIEEQILTEV